MKKFFKTMLPIMQTSLPPFVRMVPYLEQIEKNRCHSNFGKLHHLFEARMAALFKIPPEYCALVCNGTLALVAALMALRLSPGKYCLLPSWTFSATPASALLAGLQPYFLDVDLTTQTLTPERVKKVLAENNWSAAEVGAIMPVAPFGAPVIRQAWDDFTKETQIPVLIDAAAAFDTILNLPQMQVGLTPMMVSLHATKIFGIGEGGMVLSSNKAFIQKIKEISNFCFNSQRLSTELGLNAKMSEYQAAIGLAVLDSWPEIRAQRLKVTEQYLKLCQRLGVKAWLSTEWLSSSCNILLPHRAEAAKNFLLTCNIESRIWWNQGCHTYPAYHHLARENNLNNTAYLGATMVGLPYSIDTSPEQIQRVGEALEIFLLNQKPQPQTKPKSKQQYVPEESQDT